MIKHKLVTLISSLLFSFSVLANETPAVIGGVEDGLRRKSAALEQVRKKLGKMERNHDSRSNWSCFRCLL